MGNLLAFLNELSQAESNDESVHLAMSNLTSLLVSLKKRRPEVALVSVEALASLELAVGYPFNKWAGDGKNRDRVRFLLGLQNRAPFNVVGTLEGEAEIIDYSCAGRVAVGLGYAHAFNGLAVSLVGEETSEWRTAEVALSKSWLSETSGTLVPDVSSVVVRHAATVEHLDEHDTWLRIAGAEDIRTGNVIWEERADLFPNLDLAPGLEKNLLNLNSHWVAPVVELLVGLNTATEDWDPKTSPHPDWPTHVTPESQSRRHLCMFRDLDGEVRMFEMHARMTPGAGRLHFRLNPSVGRLTIGYVGRKLGE